MNKGTLAVASLLVLVFNNANADGLLVEAGGTLTATTSPITVMTTGASTSTGSTSSSTTGDSTSTVGNLTTGSSTSTTGASTATGGTSSSTTGDSTSSGNTSGNASVTSNYAASTQMALFAIAKTLIHNNEFIVFEQLSNPMARQAFANCGANILNISHDNQGIDIANLELLCVQYKVRAVYLSPQQQIPTTISMSAKRRQELQALSESYQFLIIEDDDCHEFNFSNHASLPMASQVKSNNTLYLGSLSGLLGHALNLSFIVAQDECVEECAAQINLMDGQADQVSQMAMTELLKNGEIKRHLARSLKIYAERRSHVANLLQAELAEFVSFRLPECGLAIWLELSPSINMLRLQADAELEKVSFTAANYYSSSEHQVSAIRLGYAHLNEEDISLGIKRLKVAFINQQGQLLRA